MNRWKMKLMALTLTGCALLSAAGCGGKTGSSGNKKAGANGQITLYTSQPEADVQKVITAFNQEHPNIKVSVFRSGTEEVISKVMAEEKAGSIKADVLLVADDVTFTRLKDRKLLEAYESKELKEIPASFIDKDHMYTGTKVITTGIMINTQKAGSLKPTALSDLTKPEYKDKVIMPSPLYSGAAAYNLGVLTRTRGIGWDWYKALKANGIKVDKGNGAVQKAVAAGEKTYGLVADYMANRARKKGSPVAFVYPAEGSPLVTEPIGLMKASRNKEAAKCFIDFVLSQKGQQIAADMGYTPVRKGIKAPEGLKSMDAFKALTGDVSILFKNRESDKSQFSKLFQ
jgi:iron(III) transport system substrate-binding protein